MQNAPARQPRVSPAAPGVGRAWATAACLTGAVILAGAVILPPFAAGYLFPSRSTALSPKASAQPSAPPLGAEPANEPPRSVASEGAPDAASAGTLTGGALATGVFASRTAPEAATAAEPSIELAVRPIPPLGAAAAAPAEARPGVSPPPARREPLPLQTDLLPAETPGPPPLAKPGPDRHG